MIRQICRALGVLSALPLSVAALAQTAQFSGRVTDPQQAIVRGAEVRVVNQATGVERIAKTNTDGVYQIPFVQPGTYQIFVQAQGFSTAASQPLIVTVGQALVFDVQLKVGDTSEHVTVNASDRQINTTDGSVSTVIDSKFVQNIPLNGRSFESLILSTPGVVTNSPQLPVSYLGTTGEFSVNGQRTESNYFTVDGVSANTGSPLLQPSPAAGGSLPSSTALGTTQSLVSVDALQEFRVESSTYSAEYGRNPGGQFSFVTRSGTNDWHGTAFDYLRNDALDANDWFNDNTIPPTPKTAERQNDFGGTFGGPIRFPRLYDGRNKSFFFFSYEGLRLVSPSPATVNAVPDLALRQSVTGPLQAALNAFPLPTSGYPDLVSGMGQFVAAWSNPSQSDATSIRLDHTLGDRLHLFFRFSDTPSSTSARQTSALYGTPSEIYSQAYISRTYTFGATATLSRNLTDDFRVNYSTNNTTSQYANDAFGGAIPVNLFSLQGISSNSSAVSIAPNFGGYYPELTEAGTLTGKQAQWNVVDALSLQRGSHLIKIGLDWRRLAPTIPAQTIDAEYTYFSEADVANNSVDDGLGLSNAINEPLYTNFSAFIQDEWKTTSRLHVSTGLRWEVNPAPGATHGLKPYTVIGLDDPATMTLAPQGTPLWDTEWFSLAPRIGVAYTVHNEPGRETVLRGGAGVFFDTGQQTGSYGFQGVGFSGEYDFGTENGTSASFPVAPALVSPPIVNPPVAPYDYVFANPAHFQPPYTLQWNTALEQGLGRSQSLTISYVGANGRKLLRENFSNISSINPNFEYFYVFTNGLTSSYNALQMKYQRQVTHGLQVLASYTWSHALDYGSYSASFPYEHGNSNLDVRNNGAAALSYDLPATTTTAWSHILSSNWGIDARLTARSGFPVTLNGSAFYDPYTLQLEYSGLNLVPDAPLYLHGDTYPGRRRINPAAFTVPTRGQSGNAPRNFVNGFGAVQGDLAIRRSFPIFERLQGQFRAESFNFMNHPNFGTIGDICGGAVGATCGNVQFGLATQTLANSLGNLSPLYQMGGPRSLQLALKLIF